MDCDKEATSVAVDDKALVRSVCVRPPKDQLEVEVEVEVEVGMEHKLAAVNRVETVPLSELSKVAALFKGTVNGLASGAQIV